MRDWLIFGGCLALVAAAFVFDSVTTRRLASAGRERFLTEERRETTGSLQNHEELDAVRLGMLAGGWRRAADVQLAGLVTRGMLRRASPDASAPEQWMANDVATDAAGTDLERKVHKAAASGAYLWSLSPVLRSS